MTIADRLRRQFEYDHWANRAALESLASAPDSTEARVLLSHVVSSEEIWLARITGAEYTMGIIWEQSPESELERRIDALYARWQHLFDWIAAHPEMLEKRVQYTTSKGDAYDSEIGEVLQHVLLHAAYHRGQIASRVKAAGGKPAVTDFIFFTRQA